jgi:GalNAc-alpha-(1->4)-GalNAc-alpha-(1->3)-diNAcBac-PP-undecaprenol alpha-1,4-N-acetyl-D-galactosaminyltransferase
MAKLSGQWLRLENCAAMAAAMTMGAHADGYCAPPRLVLIIGSLQAGGAERQLSDMANYWFGRGAEVTLATWSGPEVKDFYPLASGISRRWLNVRVQRLTPFAALVASVRRVYRLRLMLRTLRPDAIVSFIDISNIYTVLATRGMNVRVVISERTHPANNRTIGMAWRLLRRICYRRADVVVAQTQDAGRWLERNCHARVKVIPNSLRNLPQIRRERELMIIAVGRLSKEKGFDLLVKSFARIAVNYPMWRICIIGEGPERQALAELRDELGLMDRVEFVGEVRDVELWMARASLLVHPSRREGFPNTVLEAMGMGLPVICADCRAGPSEMIADGINGRLVPVDDMDALTGVMSELMAKPELRNRLGREACNVRQLFRQEITMDKWEACTFPQSKVAWNK